MILYISKTEGVKHKQFYYYVKMQYGLKKEKKGCTAATAGPTNYEP
jgi:hypothetical protein